MLILFCDIVYDVHFKNNVTYLQVLWLHCNLSKAYLISGAEKVSSAFHLTVQTLHSENRSVYRQTKYVATDPLFDYWICYLKM